MQANNPVNLDCMLTSHNMPHYLDFATCGFILSVVESIRAIADMVFLDKFLGVSSSLRSNPRYVLYAAKVNDQLLVKIILRSRPSVETLCWKSILSNMTMPNGSVSMCGVSFK